MKDFVALDFEFGIHMSDRISIIEVGLQKVIDGKLVDSWTTLVNPESELDSYASDNIHHIYVSDVIFAPTFREIWSKIVQFIGLLPVVVHGVKNEQHAIITNCRKYDLEIVNFKYVDTLKIAQKLMPKLPKYNVGYLASYFKLPPITEHAALDDAQLTAQIYLALRSQFGEYEIAKIYSY